MKIKKCPICKSKDVHLEHHPKFDNGYYVECNYCSLRTAYWYKEKALQMWNLRGKKK